jgi:hypothetical protein
MDRASISAAPTIHADSRGFMPSIQASTVPDEIG